MVTLSYSLLIWPVSSGNTEPIVVSQCKRPFSMSMADKVAVIDLVQEPIWKTSFVVNGVGLPSLRTPTAANSQIFPFLLTMVASPGKPYFARTASRALVLFSKGSLGAASARKPAAANSEASERQ